MCMWVDGKHVKNYNTIKNVREKERDEKALMVGEIMAYKWVSVLAIVMAAGDDGAINEPVFTFIKFNSIISKINDHNFSPS